MDQPLCADGRRVVLPLPRYGRGLELIALMENFPQAGDHCRGWGYRGCGAGVPGTVSGCVQGREEQIRAFLEEQPEKQLERDVYDILCCWGHTLGAGERCGVWRSRSWRRGRSCDHYGQSKARRFHLNALDGKRRSGAFSPTTRVWGGLWRFWSKIIFRPVVPFHCMDAGRLYFQAAGTGSERGD